MQPAASAEPSLRAALPIGKFHAEKPAVGPDRLLDHLKAGFADAARNDAAIGAAALLGEPLHFLAGEMGFETGLGNRLAHFQRCQHGDLFLALMHQLRRPLEDATALPRALGTP